MFWSSIPTSMELITHILTEKEEFLNKNIQKSCQFLNNSDHQVPDTIVFDLMVLSSKITTPSVKFMKFNVEIFLEEIEPALMEWTGFDIELKQSY